MKMLLQLIATFNFAQSNVETVLESFTPQLLEVSNAHGSHGKISILYKFKTTYV